MVAALVRLRARLQPRPEAALTELLVEVGKLTIDVASEDDAGAPVLADHVLYYGHDFLRALPCYLSVAGLHVTGDQLDLARRRLDLEPAHVGAQLLDALVAARRRAREAAALFLVHGLAYVHAVDPDGLGEASLGEHGHVHLLLPD